MYSDHACLQQGLVDEHTEGVVQMYSDHACLRQGVVVEYTEDVVQKVVRMYLMDGSCSDRACHRRGIGAGQTGEAAHGDLMQNASLWSRVVAEDAGVVVHKVAHRDNACPDHAGL